MSDSVNQFDLAEVQEALRETGVDGWLFAQFRGRDPIANRVLGLAEGGLQTRRWFYYVPADGEPRGMVHAIEPNVLNSLPGEALRYMRWQELQEGIGRLIGDAKRVAMQYAPNNHIPYVALVDAGTVELVMACGVEVVSSAEMMQRFTARLTDWQIASHHQAAAQLPGIVKTAFGLVRERVTTGAKLTEYEVQQYILECFEKGGLVTDKPPIVGVNENSADPHYIPAPEGSAPIRRGDWLLIDLFAHTPDTHAVWADITWTAQVDSEIPDQRAEIFHVVRRARDASVTLIRDRYVSGSAVTGCEADCASREVIEAAGYGSGIKHRTGHSITDELHGTGACLDDLETHDFRRLIRRTCFSVEPGIYLDAFGVRSEVDVLIPPKGVPEVTGKQQDAPILLLAPNGF